MCEIIQSSLLCRPLFLPTLHSALIRPRRTVALFWLCEVVPYGLVLPRLNCWRPVLDAAVCVVRRRAVVSVPTSPSSHLWRCGVRNVRNFATCDIEENLRYRATARACALWVCMRKSGEGRFVHDARAAGVRRAGGGRASAPASSGAWFGRPRARVELTERGEVGRAVRCVRLMRRPVRRGRADVNA
eukprot:scaffold37003_cov61-Phaeocystis_antarctica.AAC.2